VTGAAGLTSCMSYPENRFTLFRIVPYRSPGAVKNFSP
jgi:hypothetical protein